MSYPNPSSQISASWQLLVSIYGISENYNHIDLRDLLFSWKSAGLHKEKNSFSANFNVVFESIKWTFG